MLLPPRQCELIELSDDQTGFPGDRPNRPYLVIRQYPARVRVMALSSNPDPRAFELPPGSAHGLTEPTFTVNWSRSIDYLTAIEATSLGHLPANLCRAVLEFIRGRYAER